MEETEAMHEFTVEFWRKCARGLCLVLFTNMREPALVVTLGKDLICRQFRINDILATLSNNEHIIWPV